MSGRTERAPCSTYDISSKESERAVQLTVAIEHNDAPTTYEKTLSTILDVGESMLAAGADVSLVEEEVQKMVFAAGAEKADVFALSSLIIASITTPDGRVYSENRRFARGVNTDFEKLEDLHLLSVEYCAGKLSAPDLQRRRDAIAKRSLPNVMMYIGAVLSTAGFAVFFGGTLLDGIVSALFAIIICLMITFVKPHLVNENVFLFLAAFVSGLGIAAVAKVVPDLNMGMTIVGTIMILIPGIAVTNSARDMLSGDVITGIVGLVQALIASTVLAVGYIAALWLLSAGMVDTPDTLQTSLPVQLGAALVATLGFAMFYDVKKREIPALVIGGFLVWVVYLGMKALVPDATFLDTFIASVVGALFSVGMGLWFKVPASIFFYVAVITLIPGRMLYFTMACAAAGSWALFENFATMTLVAVLGIAAGMSLIWAFAALVLKSRW